ncbi:hypothetical protein TCAL_02811 [Tigriopus californicus]|uniref:Ubiquitinyl hydrolase 1 n=1 Tax=Tigriopus californicus TaxID=6832 RepID=A0A553NX37_TIGCA|nr:hypothetical protein TCAL_02811 [Tigriopus californicus]
MRPVQPYSLNQSSGRDRHAKRQAHRGFPGLSPLSPSQTHAHARVFRLDRPHPEQVKQVKQAEEGHRHPFPPCPLRVIHRSRWTPPNRDLRVRPAGLAALRPGGSSSTAVTIASKGRKRAWRAEAEAQEDRERRQNQPEPLDRERKAEDEGQGGGPPRPVNGRHPRPTRDYSGRSPRRRRRQNRKSQSSRSPSHSPGRPNRVDTPRPTSLSAAPASTSAATTTLSSSSSSSTSTSTMTTELSSDFDENLSTLLSMGFPDLDEIKRALKTSKNDLVEAVSILTNDVPSISSKRDHSDFSSGSNAGSTQDAKIGPENMEQDETGFPVGNLYELETRVFQENWSIPYKREESLGKCLVGATKLAQDGLMDSHEQCTRFIDKILPEAFRKLLSSNATQRWQIEIQEGIQDMLFLLIDLVLARVSGEPLPYGLLQILTLAFDIKNGWNYTNRQRHSRLWESANRTTPAVVFAQPLEASRSHEYEWLCDLLNHFGQSNGFKIFIDLIDKYESDGKLDVRVLAALLTPFGGCAEILVQSEVDPMLGPCLDKTFKVIEHLQDSDIRGKEITAVSDLLTSLKLICHHFKSSKSDFCDDQRLGIILRMLKTPHFSSKMNALKEVSRLIDESADRNRGLSVEQVVDWMVENQVLSVTLEGNIDQVQYTDRIKSIVEFLGPRLSLEELTKMWKLQESSNAHVTDNIYAIMSGAAAKFNMSQFDHLTALIKETWQNATDRVREKLLVLIGQIGKEATQSKSTRAILEVLWEISHVDGLPRPLVENALKEQLAILAEMTVNKVAVRKIYILKCIDDIKASTRHAVSSVKHLHDICRTFSKGTSFYQKADKSTLGELNQQHEIVKCLSMSLQQCLDKADKTAPILGPSNQLLHSHSELISCHLDLLAFLLKEGDLYLSWSRCKELWNTLIINPNTTSKDKDDLFVWFETCISDLEQNTLLDLFKLKMLSFDPADITEKAFSCFKALFEIINVAKGFLKKSTSSSLIVENRELVGMSYLWKIVSECESDEIADKAIDYLLKTSYFNLSSSLKANLVELHQDFFTSCYGLLDVALRSSSVTEGVERGLEIEAARRSSFSETLTTVRISNLSILPLDLKGKTLRTVSRIFLLLECYISRIEELFPGERTLLPHVAAFHGSGVEINVVHESKNEEHQVLTHTNEYIGNIKKRISAETGVVTDNLKLFLDDVEISSAKNKCFLHSLSSEPEQKWTLKAQGGTSTALVLFQDSVSPNQKNGGDLFDAMTSSTSSGEDSNTALEQMEKELPGVVMALKGKIFWVLNHLSSINDRQVVQRLRKLIHIIPTDSAVLDNLDSVSYYFALAGSSRAADASPKMSPRFKKAPDVLESLESVRDCLSKLFDPTTEGMGAFKLLYNLEVLSGRLMPTKNDTVLASAAQKFSNHFVQAGGLELILHVLDRQAMAPDVDYDLRQSVYLITLQIAHHLLCGQPAKLQMCTITSPGMKPTPPKRSALDSSLSTSKSPSVISATKKVQTMKDDQFWTMITCLMRVIWAAAAGNLQLATSSMSKPKLGDHPRFQLGRRSRDSSTGSSGSEGSSSEAAPSLHSGVCSQQSFVNDGDCRIAGGAFELMITCLEMRTLSIAKFFTLPLVSDFIVDIVLGSQSGFVRRKACQQLIRLTNIRVAARSLNLDNLESKGPLTPKQLLTKVILKSPVPLWMPSSKSRGISPIILSHSAEYFDLRCALLRSLDLREQKEFEVNAKTMIDDELTFLQNFTVSNRFEDCTLLAGHLKLVETLLTCEGIDKKKLGKKLVFNLLASFLFPASRIRTDASDPCSRKQNLNFNPKCDNTESRVAAYNLLIQLAKGCSSNASLIVGELIQIHHFFNENQLKEFDNEPSVERRADSNFVGLKNAGATCYMNSVLQQLFCTPGICEQVLSMNIDNYEEDTIYYQLQNVFGHLKESQLQFYKPEKFWRCFRLYGQPVNVREQQDAFEFYTQILDQADEHLAKFNKAKTFKAQFEGVFSDQKICQGCPHRYEREETFMALNLPVKSNNLQESLDQFVKGELLEGDNAYFCEKCKVKRNTVKRMCIRTLPPTLVIQLKRFHYDWETNRSLKFDDVFQFPWTIDMGPYTTEGIHLKEKASPNELAIELGKEPYRLVGVLVHSGQASAGHYYSFIKERRSKNISGSNHGKWFKFNDTTVEEFDMNNDSLTTECFGGNYKVKKDDSNTSNSHLPEERQRYWNAYMLFYEYTGSPSTKSGKMPRKNSSQSQSRLSARKNARKTSEPAIPPRESFSQLSDLVVKGEEKGIFLNKMPPPIERDIQEENLRFLENRDVFCREYYTFITELIQVNMTRKPQMSDDEYDQLGTYSLRLGIHFLLNTYFHLKRKDSALIGEIVNACQSLCRSSLKCCDWLLSFLIGEGQVYLRPFLIECPSKEVRHNSARIVLMAMEFYEKHHGSDQDEKVASLLVHVVSILSQDVPNHGKHSGQFFWLLSQYARLGPKHCQKLFNLNAFSHVFKFLLGCEPEPENPEDLLNQRRRWTGLQIRDFGEVHLVLAHMILSCDLTKHRDIIDDSKPPDSVASNVARAHGDSSEGRNPMPSTLTNVLFGAIAPLFIRECICAIKEDNTEGVGPIMEMLVQVAFKDSKFSENLISELLKQYSNANPGELKNLSSLLCDILVRNFIFWEGKGMNQVLQDSFQGDRVKYVIEGKESSSVEGLLTLVTNNQSSESRTYQCIKTLVVASNRSSAVKDYLLQDSKRWEWAVNWLKSKMSDDFNWNSNEDVVSNEDSNIRTFHRTTSAQVTLDEANAILAEFGGTKSPKELLVPSCSRSISTTKKTAASLSTGTQSHCEGMETDQKCEDEEMPEHS